MIDKLKEKIAEFTEIAKSCPDNLQEKCFEILLAHYLDTLTPAESIRVGVIASEAEMEKERGKPQVKQQDIIDRDLHVRARKFLKKYKVTIDEINEIFYKEDKKILPLYDDLKTTLISESQIRTALLKALEKGLVDGEFSFNGEEIRQECMKRKCYDAANFVAHFKHNAKLFSDFKKYNKRSPQIKLAENGLKQLSDLIKELQ